LIAYKGLNLLIILEKTRSVKNLAKEIDLSIYSVYKYLKLFLNRGLIRKINKQYVINEELWTDLKQLIIEAKSHLINSDERIPTNAKISRGGIPRPLGRFLSKIF